MSILFALMFMLAADEAAPPSVDTHGPIPSDAILIFDGELTDMLVAQDGGPFNWEVENGAIVVKPGVQERQQGLWTKLHFRDAQIHAEFMLPKSETRGNAAANSGLYIHGLFELQIIDSFENPMAAKEMAGSLYNISPPMANAARAPGEWQTYDVVYRAPRRNAEGEPVEPGMITAMLNGVVVQHGATFTTRKSKYTPLYFRTTPYTEAIREQVLHTEAGPLQLQDHDHPVRFRNIWIRPLDDNAHVWEWPTDNN